MLRMFGLWISLGFLAWATVGMAEGTGSSTAESAQSKAALPHPAMRFGFANGSFIVAPVPFKSPLIGTGLAAGGGYVFRSDEESNSSHIALAGFKTDNGSLGYGISTSLALSSNRWQARLFIGRAELNYDLYTQIGTLPIRQSGDIATLELRYGFSPEISLGITSRYLNSTITPDLGGLLPRGWQPDARLKLGTLGLVAEWDTRNDPDYPTDGIRITANGAGSTSLDGPDRTYSKVYVNADTFLPLWRDAVLAGRASLCASSDQAPFFDSCSLGLNDKFRGFPSTQYIGDRAASAQVELRQRMGGRLGAVLFAGLGGVGPSFGRLDATGHHVAGGIGARYRLSRKFPLDFSVDFSRNNQGDKLLYIYVGQRW